MAGGWLLMTNAEVRGDGTAPSRHGTMIGDSLPPVGTTVSDLYGKPGAKAHPDFHKTYRLVQEIIDRMVE